MPISQLITSNMTGEDKMNIGLVALDMDGTLLDSKKRLPHDFIDWVRSHPDIKTVIASGRQYPTLAKELHELKDDLIFIAENGGLVVKSDEVIYLDNMKKEDVKHCLDIILKNPDMTPVLCGVKSAYMPESDAEIKQIVDVYYVALEVSDDLYSCVDKDDIIKLAVHIRGKKAEQSMSYFDDLGDGITPVLSGDSWIDIANASVNKGAAVTAVLARYGIDREASMSFGDYLNDYELIEACEESYCMENGHPDLKRIAKHIAASNDDDGVMKVLREL